jgi:hypothetical protein
MTNATLTSPDLAVGGVVVIEGVDGSGVKFITVVGAPPPGPGGNFWPYDAPIPASVVNPQLRQAQALVGPGGPTWIRTQAAATGSGAVGGDLNYVLGKPENLSATQGFGWFFENVIDSVTRSDLFGMMALRQNAGGVTILGLGLGTDGNGAGVAAAEISAPAELNIATELGAGGQSPIHLQPAGLFGSGQSFFEFSQAADGTPYVILSESPADPGASLGVLRFAWDTSSGPDNGLLVQRNNGDTQDFEIAARQFGELIFGNLFEGNRYHARDRVLFEIFLGTGLGWNYAGPTGVTFNIGTDGNKTIRQGGDAGKDARGEQLYAADLVGSVANQDIATIDMTTLGNDPLPDHVEQLRVHVVGVDQVTGEWATFDMVSGFRLAAGVVTGATVAATPSDTGHSAAGIPTVPLSFDIVGTTVLVQVGPFALTASHWTINSERIINSGTS